MFIREECWLKPLFKLQCLKERPCLHRFIVLLLDIFLPVLCLTLFITGCFLLA
jgi:hypothetical protein